MVFNNGEFYPIVLGFILVWWSGISSGCRPLKFVGEVAEIVLGWKYGQPLDQRRLKEKGCHSPVHLGRVHCGILLKL